MQATYSNLRSRLMMGLLLIAVTLISTTNSWANFYSAQLQDSITEASIDSFIAKNQITENYSAAFREFYGTNKHQFVWMQTKGVKLIAKDFITHANKLTPGTIDSSFLGPLTKQSFLPNGAALHIELSLSHAFFKYADTWLSPSNMDPSSVNWLIPKKTISLANQLKNWLSPATKMGFNTGSQNFKLLLENYTSLSRIAALDTGININPSNIKIKKGDMVPVIRQIKRNYNYLAISKAQIPVRCIAIRLALLLINFKKEWGSLPPVSLTKPC